MKTLLFSLLLWCTTGFISFAQYAGAELPSQKATPAGGWDRYLMQVQEELHYPQPALKANIQGQVVVRLRVLEDGSTDSYVVQQGLGHGCDEMALMAVKSINLKHAWMVAKDEGIAMDEYVEIPVHFSLPNKKRKKDDMIAQSATEQLAALPSLHMYAENIAQPIQGLPELFRRMEGQLARFPFKELEDVQYVYVLFSVDTQGKPTNFYLYKDTADNQDSQQIFSMFKTTVESMEWLPASQGDEKVNQMLYFRVPCSLSAVRQPLSVSQR